MNVLRSFATVVATALAVAAISLYGINLGRASDHQDSPTVVARPGADITDVFVYPAPDNPSQNVVLAMDIYPLIPAGMSGESSFALDPAVLYQFKIASNIASNDNTEKTVIQFMANAGGQSQTVTMYGPAKPNEIGTTNTKIKPTGTFNFNSPSKLQNGQVQVFAGLRRDPFFFDLAQFFKIIPDRNAAYHAPGATVPPPSATSFNGFPANATNCLTTPANNYLANFDVIQIAVELPKTMLEQGGSLGKIGVWATASTTTGS